MNSSPAKLPESSGPAPVLDMLLHTPIYLIFLSLVVLLYWAIPWQRGRKGLLIASSYVFYLTFDWRFACLLFVLSVTTYLIGRVIHAGWRPREFAWLSVIINLGVLGIFKYANFFIDSVSAGLNALNLQVVSPSLQLLLPVGISFYTFQAISYTMEVYRKKIEPPNEFVDFALYMAFFPKLIAGPFVRPAVFLNKLKEPLLPPNRDDLQSALGLLLLGLVKKWLIADSLASLGEAAFRAAALPGEPTGFNTPLFLQGFYLYAFQIYADFSGYTDLARASGRLLGIELPENFQQPYLAISLTSFWNRWHMTLTQWFREYLYFPITRRLLIITNRRYLHAVQIIANLATMTLIGLWHGAAWTYVAWGLWHGLLLSLESFYIFKPERRWQRLVMGVVTFHIVGVGWILFRAGSFSVAWHFLSSLVAFNQMRWLPYYLPSILTTGGLTLAFDLLSSKNVKVSKSLRQMSRPILVVSAIVVIINLVLLSLAHGSDVRPFIYGQF